MNNPDKEVEKGEDRTQGERMRMNNSEKDVEKGEDRTQGGRMRMNNPDKEVEKGVETEHKEVEKGGPNMDENEQPGQRR